MTDYSDTILETYKELKRKPRGDQQEIINDLLNEFIDKDKKYVALNASTGLGKSNIAVVTSISLKKLIGEKQKNSFILMHNNTLLKQYEDDFKDKTSCLTLLGAGNYNCSVLNDSAEHCVSSRLINAKDPRVSECEHCEYKQSRKAIHYAEQIFTNYSYFFVSSLYSDFLKPRLLTVYDEAQLVNDIFVNHMKIFVSVNTLEKYKKELEATHELENLVNDIQEVITDLKLKKINEKNAIEIYLNKLSKIYIEASKFFLHEAEIADLHSPERFKKMSKIANKFKNLNGKIEDFFHFKYEHVVEVKDDEFSIQTIFMNEMFKKTHLSEYHLFMSATIDPYFMSTTMGINQSEIGFVKPRPAFKKENKKVNFLNLAKYNYESMKKPDTIPNMVGYVKKVINKHKNDNGIILAPSFWISNSISIALKKYLKENKIDIRVFNQEQGEHLSYTLARFKSYKKKSVLISPSIFEGVDLPGELSRYQIFIKAPYASLADKRIKVIANNYPRIYRTMTLYRILQGFGRSCRNPDDYCTSYCFDEGLYYLYNSDLNLWKNEYDVSVVRR